MWRLADQVNRATHVSHRKFHQKRLQEGIEYLQSALLAEQKVAGTRAKQMQAMDADGKRQVLADRTMARIAEAAENACDVYRVNVSTPCGPGVER